MNIKKQNSKTPISIEAVTVCINFSDHLKYCVGNKKFLDRWVIITVETDFETINLCKQFSLEYYFSNRIYEHGAPFSKGKAINEGVLHIEKSGWLLILDCDIVLPQNFRQVVASIAPSKGNLNSLFGVRGRRLIGAPPEYLSTIDYKLLKKVHKVYVEAFDQLKKKPKDLNFATIESLRQNLQAKHFDKGQTGSHKRQWKHFSEGNWNKLVYVFEDVASEHLGYFQLFSSKNFSSYPEERR